VIADWKAQLFLLVVAIGIAVAGWQWVASASPSPGLIRTPRPARIDRPSSNVVCQPLFVCDIVLAPGEVIESMATGDSVRWILSTAVSGPNGDTPHVLVKATDYGLRTNLIVTTDRRVCYVILVSTKHDYQYRARFYYPIEEVAHIKPNARRVLDLANLDFAYQVRGDRSFMPLHVMNDGVHTYIEMPQGIQDLPAVFVIGNDGSDTIVNYRYRGRSFIVDGVPQKIALVQGSGRSQRRVIIERGN